MRGKPKTCATAMPTSGIRQNDLESESRIDRIGRVHRIDVRFDGNHRCGISMLASCRALIYYSNDIFYE
jgi:hypothetical protein